MSSTLETVSQIILLCGQIWRFSPRLKKKWVISFTPGKVQQSAQLTDELTVIDICAMNEI